MDSTVLHYMLDEALPGNDIPRVFINTGIEYAAVSKFVFDLALTDKRIQIISPKRNIRQMLNEVGYPFKSKEHSKNVSIYQRHGKTKAVKRYLREDPEDPYRDTTKFQCPKILRYQFTEDFTMKISEKCCNELKKKPAKEWSKENGRPVAIVGLRMAEGGQRANHEGCTVFRDGKLVTFKPLNPVSDEFMDWYAKSRNIKLCELYYEPYNMTRTGCKGCPFAIDLQKQLDMMEEYLPLEKAQCEFIWEPIYSEYRRINYRLRMEDKLF